MKTVKVWDASVRIFHWALAALVGAAFLTGDDETIAWHVRGGVLIAGLLVYRIVWGLVGPGPARFRSFVKGPRTVIAYLRDYVRGKPPVHRSHNPLGAVMVVTLLFVLFGAVVTGALAYSSAEWDGPLAAFIGERAGHGLKEVHEVFANSLLVLVPLHVLGVIVSSFLERQNLVKGMVTGMKKDAENPAPSATAPTTRFAFAVVVAVGVVAGLTTFLKPVSAKADSASATSMLRSLETQARAADPGFQRFSAEAGRTLFTTEHPVKGKQVACSTCHGSDPAKPGRTPSGKKLAPFSPLANSRAFSNPGKAEKKFDRYCKEVLGRACTPREKGDVLAWLLGT